MKKFVFRLQVVLNRALEEEERLQQQLAQLRNELMQKDHEIADMRMKRQQLLDRVGEMQQGLINVQDLQTGYFRLEDLGNALVDLTNQRREIENRVAAKQRETVEAMRKRQVLEKLREKELGEYKKQVERVELQTMEEAVLPRLAREHAAERARLERSQNNGGES